MIEDVLNEIVKRAARATATDASKAAAERLRSLQFVLETLNQAERAKLGKKVPPSRTFLTASTRSWPARDFAT